MYVSHGQKDKRCNKIPNSLEDWLLWSYSKWYGLDFLFSFLYFWPVWLK
jgi:hypothetical protein